MHRKSHIDWVTQSITDGGFVTSIAKTGNSIVMLTLLSLFCVSSWTDTHTVKAEAAPSNTAGPSRVNKSATSFRTLPLSFEANRGQLEKEVKFISRGLRGSVVFRPTKVTLRLSKLPSNEELTMRLAGSARNSRVDGIEKLKGTVNYFVGSDRRKWVSAIPTYSRVLYKNVYKGIDQVFYGNEQDLEYDFIVAPGSDPSVIKIAFDGHKRIEMDGGDILFQMNSGKSFRMHKPVAYQFKDGSKNYIPAEYIVRKDGNIQFKIGRYDRRRQLIIDPILSYSTYLGESGNDTAFGISSDGLGNSYITGSTDSAEMSETPPGGTNVLVTKMNPQGTQRLYAAVLGGEGDEAGFDIKSGANGSVFITGSTSSSDFPVVNATQPIYGGGFQDCFVAKLDPQGAPLYSTFLGGSGDDACYGLDSDSLGNAYVTGSTDSTDLPETPSLTGSNVFVAKLGPTGSELIYRPIFGGNGDDIGYSIAVGGDGSTYITGSTDSENFTTEKPLQPQIGGAQDIFIARLDADGAALVYSTYLGGSGSDSGFDIAVDTGGNAYVVGSTNSPEFSSLEGSNVFATKFSPDGSERIYFAIIGGNGDDVAFSVALDNANCAYITGSTNSTNFTTAEPLQASLGGSQDGFVAKLNAAGNSLIYSTFLGGGSNEAGFGIAVDAQGAAYVAGFTSSEDFVLVNPNQAVLGGGGDAFVVKIAPDGSGPQPVTVAGQVLTAGGLGLRNANVTLTDSQGVRRVVLTSSLGFFSFDNVTVGQNYIVSVQSKRYRFASQNLPVTGDIPNLLFMGLE